MRHLAAILLCAFTASVATAKQYTISNLGPLFPFDSWATSINNSGQVVGTYDAGAGNYRSFLYSSGMLSQIAPSLTLGNVVATDINEAGIVVGYVGGAAYLLAPEPIRPISAGFAVAINNAGTVLIQSGSPSVPSVVSGQQSTPIGTLGGSTAQSWQINNMGDVVGTSWLADGSESTAHAFLYRQGQMMDLGTLGGDRSEARGVNDLGQVVGLSHIDGSGEANERAFLWVNGLLTSLGTLGGPQSAAIAINNQGQIVGWSRISPATHESHGFLYTNGQMLDLVTLPDVVNAGWLSLSPVAINDAGQIVGSGEIFINGNRRVAAFVLSPVPEPMQHSMLIAGLVAMFAHLHRRGRLNGRNFHGHTVNGNEQPH